MTKVITYGTFDLLHEGHIRLLERAKKLGDYLIVGVTSDSFDKTRGKINVTQSLAERIKGVKDTGLADEIIVEEYEGQKIDDIQRFGVDIFTVGSDWRGKFDYLKPFCDVVYLERTVGISSTDLRSKSSGLRLGVIGKALPAYKVIRESAFVNGVSISGIYNAHPEAIPDDVKGLCPHFPDLESLIDVSDAVYIVSAPKKHFEQIKRCLLKGKHVLCETPIALTEGEWLELRALSQEKHLVLMDACKTAFSTAYYRLVLMVKTGAIGDVVSIDSTCTSLKDLNKYNDLDEEWPCICSWGTTALLPILQILGSNYRNVSFVTRYKEGGDRFDVFTKIDLSYEHSTATAKSGIGMKSEGDLVVSGTKGYIYVPAPWWKTDYFEIRYENPADNKKVFYQLEGEGIRYELLSFLKAIKGGQRSLGVAEEVSRAMTKIIESFMHGDCVETI